MSERTITILLIEDNPRDAEILQAALAKETGRPFRLEHTDHLSEGLERLSRAGVDLILLDLLLPDSHGIDTVARVHAQAPQVPIVVLTSSDDDALALQAVQQGAQDYLVKGYVQVYSNLLGRSIRYAIERKRAEEALHQAHAQTERLLSSIPSILIQIDSRGCITHWNAVAERTFGIQARSVIHRPLSGCGVSWDRERILSSVSHCRENRALTSLDDVPFKRADGQEGFLGLTFIPMAGAAGEEGAVLVFGADVTQRQQAELERGRLQRQLMQAQKIETIGRFAGGISHDFNNFLQAILGFAWLIRARYEHDSTLLTDLQEIVHAAESASAMVRQLLAFSRRQPLQLKAMEINQTVQHMGRLLQQLVGEHIRLELQVSPQPLTVQMDPTAVEQILMNLCANARDSMPQGGTLSVRTGSAVLDEATLRRRSWDLKPGPYVQLSIQDTGSGMDPDVAAHIFEPFFTTKQAGRGTGLGLAVVYGLVRQHDGLIDIETALGQGTTFHLYFPIRAIESAQPPANAQAAPEALQKAEGVLVGESDERQRALDVETLRESGYRIVGSCSPSDVLDFFAQHPKGISALLLEAPMPGASSRDLVQRLRALQPSLKILLISGFVDEPLRALESGVEGVRLLQRPYLPTQLAAGLRQLMSSGLCPKTDSATATAATSPQKTKPRILVVDDDQPVRIFCERILRESYEVTAVGSAAAALDRLGSGSYDLLLTDLRMPQMDGVTLLREVIRSQPAQRVMAMTGSLTPDLEQRLSSIPLAAEVVRKPFSAPALLEVIGRCLSAQPKVGEGGESSNGG